MINVKINSKSQSILLYDYSILLEKYVSILLNYLCTYSCNIYIYLKLLGEILCQKARTVQDKSMPYKHVSKLL